MPTVMMSLIFDNFPDPDVLEAEGKVQRHVLVAFLEAVVLLDAVKVVSR